MIREDLRQYLIELPAIAALLTREGRVRVHQNRIPQGNKSRDAYPAVVFRRLNGGHGHDLDGSDGTAEPMFVFAVLAEDPSDVETIAEALRQALQGLGSKEPVAIGDGQTIIQGITLEDDYDDSIESDLGDDVAFHVTYLKFQIFYQESIPTFA